MKGFTNAHRVGLLCLLAASAAQEFGSVGGIVTDATGAAVPNAPVRLTDVSKKFDQQTVTNNIGEYRFQPVPAGKYEVTISAPGFQVFRQEITVDAAKRTTVNAQIQVGSVTETIEVHASSPAFSTSTATMQANARVYRAPRVPARGVRMKTEQYDSFVENEFADTARSPLSTVAADVDTASYSNVRRFLQQEQRLPPPGAVRIEELINYFTYGYAEPSEGQPFSVAANVASCPWNPKHKLLHLGLKTPRVDVERMPPANLVLLVDVSGSMGDENKLPLAKRALRLLVDSLREQDHVALTVYAGSSGVVLQPTSGREKSRILAAIDRLEAGGSTNGASGIQLAYETARAGFIKGGNNRVVLLTDGDFNVGVTSQDELVRLIEKERESGVFLSGLGFGMGDLKDSTMEKLADHGNGNYAYIDSINEARKVFVEQMAGTMLTVAKDVKLQIEFNPARVKSYRLIGYENRVLRPEEFNDDKKDAGDLGAGMSLTVLYELSPAEEAGEVDPLRYQKERSKTRAAKSGEVAMLKFRYKAPEDSKSKLFQQAVIDSGARFESAPADMRFAAAVAEYGMLLRGSKFAARASYSHTIETALQSIGEDAGGHRAEFLQLARIAEELAREGVNE
ncbi:MAG: DUF3520 domain-containing protein [Acidobacteria bacterium]|nr:DUF3520 domain-containing protein [Acidobacteriota bacterium]